MLKEFSFCDWTKILGSTKACKITGVLRIAKIKRCYFPLCYPNESTCMLPLNNKKKNYWMQK